MTRAWQYMLGLTYHWHVCIESTEMSVGMFGWLPLPSLKHWIAEVLDLLAASTGRIGMVHKVDSTDVGA